MIKNLTPSWITAIITFALFASASFGSYYNALADIKSLITNTVKTEREYSESKFASKQEYILIREMLTEVRDDVKELRHSNSR